MLCPRFYRSFYAACNKHGLLVLLVLLVLFLLIVYADRECLNFIISDISRRCKCIKSCYCIMFLNVIVNMQLRQYSVCFLFSIVPECWGNLPFSRWSWQENISNNFVLLHYPALALVMAVHILKPSRTFVANCYWAHPTAEWSQKSPLQRQYWKRLPRVLATFPQKCSFAKWQNSFQMYLPSYWMYLPS